MHNDANRVGTYEFLARYAETPQPVFARHLLGVSSLLCLEFEKESRLGLGWSLFEKSAMGAPCSGA